MSKKSPHLRPVKSGEKAPKRQPATITEALDGSSTDVLVAMRRALAQQLDEGKIASNSIASAYKELRELDRLIRAAEQSAVSEQPGDDIDDTFDVNAI